MDVVQGFLFGIGFWLSVFFPFILIRLIKALKGTTATVALWKEYRWKAIQADEYEEALFVNKLINGRKDKDKISMPKGYTLKKKSEIKDKGEGSSIWDIEIKETRWIEKED